MIITPTGDLDWLDLGLLGDEIAGWSCAGIQEIVLDLSQVTHVHFGGLRGLRSRRKFLRSAGGDLCIRGASPYVRSIFRAVGAGDLLEAVPP